MRATPMKKTSQICLHAAKVLSEHHEGSCATYHSADGECTIIVLGNREVADRMLTVVDLLLEASESAEIAEIEANIGAPLIVPDEPIEA